MSNKPNGLQIKRKDKKITFSWKRAKNYKSQTLQYKITASYGGLTKKQKETLKVNKLNKWVTASGISGNTTKWEYTLDTDKLYPVNEAYVYAISFRVKGEYEEKKKGSKKTKTYKTGWCSPKTEKLKEPNAPSLKVSYDDNSPTTASFEWDAGTEQEWKPFKDVELVSKLIQECPEKISNESLWGQTTGEGKPGTYTQSYNDESVSHSESWARCVRIRARGCAGTKDKYIYAKHVWATPLKPEIISGKGNYNSETHKFGIDIAWSTPYNAQHPVDKYIIEKCVGVPTANRGLPAQAQWDPIVTQPFENAPNDKGFIPSTKTEQEPYVEEFDLSPDPDQCVWVRVTALHDRDDDNSSDPKFLWSNRLAAPTNAIITDQDPETHKVTISATNNSTVPDSVLVVELLGKDQYGSYRDIVGIIPHGSSSLSGIQCPDWTDYTFFGFNVYAATLKKQAYQTDDFGVKRYTIITYQTSEPVQVGEIPVMPQNVKVDQGDISESIKVTWEWSWKNANQAEISWSEHPNAWYSTEGPQTYTVTNTSNAQLDINGLSLGTKYYVRVRLLRYDGETTTYGPYSDIQSYYLSEAPVKPILSITNSTIKVGSTETLSWTYVSTDGTGQAYAVIYEKIGNTYRKIAKAIKENYVTIDPQKLPGDIEWTPGTTHKLAVELFSESGRSSGYSDLLSVLYAAPLVAEITRTTLELNSDGEYELKRMPLRVKSIGSAKTGKTVIQISRLTDYVQNRPDETQFTGYKGEVIYKKEWPGDGGRDIELGDLIEGKTLDDGAWYTVKAILTDENGQSDSDEIDFIVNWDEPGQAVMPSASIDIVDDHAEITIGTPESEISNETYDIYRLSADPPELIYANANRGDVIVDPYPAIGPLGGYRVVLKSKYGDYITAPDEDSPNGDFAWIDLDSNFNSKYQYIDFNGEQLRILYNVDLSSDFKKDFVTTKYLGGSYAGDWLEGVKRTGSISSVLITDEDVYDIKILRDLATYSGPCHVRTSDGSSYMANIDSGDSLGYNEAGRPMKINLNIEKTGDPESAQLQGMTQEVFNQ